MLETAQRATMRQSGNPCVAMIELFILVTESEASPPSLSRARAFTGIPEPHLTQIFPLSIRELDFLLIPHAHCASASTCFVTEPFLYWAFNNKLSLFAYVYIGIQIIEGKHKTPYANPAP